MWTVTVEAVERPLRVRFRSGDLVLRPGQPCPLSPPLARLLLRKARPGLVRIVDLSAGAWITYRSPLFGDLTAEVLGVPGNGTVAVYQPLTGAAASIPLEWVSGLAKPRGGNE